MVAHTAARTAAAASNTHHQRMREVNRRGGLVRARLYRWSAATADPAAAIRRKSGMSGMWVARLTSLSQETTATITRPAETAAEPCAAIRHRRCTEPIAHPPGSLRLGGHRERHRAPRAPPTRRGQALTTRAGQQQGA